MDGWFGQVEWGQVKTDLELQPMPPHARDIVERLLEDEYEVFPTRWVYTAKVLLRLIDLDLVEEVPAFTVSPLPKWGPGGRYFKASEFLVGIKNRGLLNELLGETNR